VRENAPFGDLYGRCATETRAAVRGYGSAGPPEMLPERSAHASKIGRLRFRFAHEVAENLKKSFVSLL